MDIKKYLDRDGLFYMANKIKGLLAAKANADLSNVDDEILASKIESSVSDKADADLGNVDDEIFAAKVESSGSNKADADLSNVDDEIFKEKAESAGVGGDGVTSVTTEGSGEAYTATMDGIESLSTDLAIILIPHETSTSTTPTLNVNGLGAVGIRRRLSINATSPQPGYSAAWLAAGKPYLLIYDGTYWIVVGQDRPASADLSGTISIEKGGTGKTTAADALTALGGMPKAGGTFEGTVYAGADNQTADEYLLRNSKLSLTEETPSVAGQVCWELK